MTTQSHMLLPFKGLLFRGGIYESFDILLEGSLSRAVATVRAFKFGELSCAVVRER